MQPRLIIGAGLFIALAAFSSAPQALAEERPEVIANSLGMKLVLVPAGEFVMGAEEDRSDTMSFFPYCDPRGLAGELPRYQARITRPFYMGQHEVTLSQFLTFYHAAKYKTEIERDGKPSLGYEKDGTLIESNRYRPWEPGWKIEMDHPVVYVSWNDATAFCRWLSKKEGKRYRLPTEAEWEYACRAGSNSRYHFGNDPEGLARYANAADADRKATYGDALVASFDERGNQTDTKIPYPFISRRDGYPCTAPVGKFQPNAFGLYDMHGNVGEWCADWWGDYAKSPTDDPQGAATGSARVARGGGFLSPPVSLRCAYRGGGDPASRASDLGFRVVCER